MCMYCSNYVEYWTIAVAAWSCGGCIMPTNCELDPRQLEDQVKDGLKIHVVSNRQCSGVTDGFYLAIRFDVLNLNEWHHPNSQLIEAEAKILVCDDFNFDEALGILRSNSVVGLKHLIVVGSEGKSQGCIPAR